MFVESSNRLISLFRRFCDLGTESIQATLEAKNKTKKIQTNGNNSNYNIQTLSNTPSSSSTVTSSTTLQSQFKPALSKQSSTLKMKSDFPKAAVNVRSAPSLIDNIPSPPSSPSLVKHSSTFPLLISSTSSSLSPSSPSSPTSIDPHSEMRSMQAQLLIKRIRLSNQISLIILLLSIPSLIFYTFLPSSNILPVFSLGSIGFMTVLFLNYLGFYNCARLFLVINFNMLTFYPSVFISKSWGTQGFYTAAIPLSLLIFDIACKPSFIFSVLLPIILRIIDDYVSDESITIVSTNVVSMGYILGGMFLLSTEYADSVKSLMAANIKSKRSYAAISQLMRTISHELRTPLNAISGMSELMLDSDLLTEEQKEMTQTISENADVLLNLINDFLTFSKASSGHMTLDINPINIEELMHDSTSSLALMAHKKNLEIIYEVSDNIPSELVGDSQRIREIIVNLLSNAIKFSDNNNPHGSIWLRCMLADEYMGDPLEGVCTSLALFDETKKDEEKKKRKKERTNQPNDLSSSGFNEVDLFLRFECEDSGIGILPQVQSRLFTPFTQADGSTTRLHGGTGLGLSICRELVELMDGRIGIISNPPAKKGSLFWFTIKLSYKRGDNVNELTINNLMFANKATESDINNFSEDKTTAATALLRIRKHVSTTSYVASYSPSTLSSISLPNKNILLIVENPSSLSCYNRMLLQVQINVTICSSIASATILLNNKYSKINPTNNPNTHTHFQVFDCVIIDQSNNIHWDDTYAFFNNVCQKQDIFLPLLVLKRWKRKSVNSAVASDYNTVHTPTSSMAFSVFGPSPPIVADLSPSSSNSSPSPSPLPQDRCVNPIDTIIKPVRKSVFYHKIEKLIEINREINRKKLISSTATVDGQSFQPISPPLLASPSTSFPASPIHPATRTLSSLIRSPGGRRIGSPGNSSRSISDNYVKVSSRVDKTAAMLIAAANKERYIPREENTSDEKVNTNKDDSTGIRTNLPSVTPSTYKNVIINSSDRFSICPATSPISLPTPFPISSLHRAATTPPISPSVSAKLRVLVAEDIKVNQKVIAKFLDRLNVDYTIVNDGAEAIESMTSTGLTNVNSNNMYDKSLSRINKFDLIAMDLNMPNIDGFTATIKLRQLGFTLPIIALTASAMQEDRDRCIAVGMTDFLSKPMKIQELKGMLVKYAGLPDTNMDNLGRAISETRKAENTSSTSSEEMIVTPRSTSVTNAKSNSTGVNNNDTNLNTNIINEQEQISNTSLNYYSATSNQGDQVEEVGTPAKVQSEGTFYRRIKTSD